MTSHKSAFTLAETLVTLLISTIVVLLIFFMSQLNWNKYKIDYFFLTVFIVIGRSNNYFLNKKNVATTVFINKNNNTIYFINPYKKKMN